MGIFFDTIYLSWGSRISPLLSLFLICVAFKLSFRPEYAPAPDYVTRTSPTYDPYPSSEFGGIFGEISDFLDPLLGFLGNVPDNACERSKHGSDLIFDFIIVGAGASGSALAACLANNTDWKILLIEAGDDPVVESVVPQTFVLGINNTANWHYNAEESNSSCQAYKNGCPMPCGKQLSGSTGHNAMEWICGQRRDYDGWAALGNEGWTYDEILPLIKRSERNTDSSKNKFYHGTDGPLIVSTNEYADPFNDALREAYRTLNYSILNDYNSEEYNGFADVQSTINRGERSNAYLAFIEPLKNKPNFFIAKNSLVTKILLNGTKAIGVNVKTSRNDCPEIKFYASKETIISAGALNSPKILMQSGIGPEAHLKAVGIEPVLNLTGVGQNLQDHVYSTHYLEINPEAKTQTTPQLLYHSFEYLAFREGYFAHLSTVNSNGFINTNNVSAKTSDIQIVANRIDKGQLDFHIVLENFGFKDEFIPPLVAANKRSHIVQVYTTVLNPVARGWIELRGNDYKLKPKIFANFLTNAEDRSKLMDGIRKLKELVKTQAFKDISAKFVKFDIKECNSLPYPSDEYEECYIRHFSADLWHPSGTCMMGPASDPQAVVNNELKVHGITNLRIADASIMPKVTSGNTQCPCYAIGQKACDLIKATWKNF